MNLWLQLNFFIAITYIIYRLGALFFKPEEKYFFEKDFFKLILVSMGLFCFTSFYPIELDLTSSVQNRFQELSPVGTPSLGSEVVTSMRESAYDMQDSHQAILLNLPFYLFLFSLSCFLFYFFKQLSHLRTLLRDSVLVKKYKRISVHYAPNLSIPCSLWLPGKYMVFLTEKTLLNDQLRDHCLAHELQHHRQGDTKLIYLFELSKALFFLNPFLHAWLKVINEHQELSCDKETVQRKKFSKSSYSRTLYDVIESHSGMIPIGAWAMASLTTYKRRFKMLQRNQGQNNLHKRILCLVAAAFMTWQGVLANESLFRQKKLSLLEAQSLTDSMESKIPLVVNEKVLKWLNYYLTHPKGKAIMRRSLHNMKDHEATVARKLHEQGMPEELAAVPLIESGYSNGAISSSRASGLWQFMAPTAKKFGLKVTSNKDERFDVKKSTLAAIKYYRSLHSIEEFKGNWHLALTAYNSGEGRLKRFMRENQTENPWELTNAGDKDYLPKLMAGMIIYKNSK